MTKKCCRCGLIKNLTEFGKHKRNKDGLMYQCRQCRSIMAKERNSKLGSDKHRKDIDLKRRYDITLDQYNEMFIKQGGVCAICFKPETSIDHRTNKPRCLAVDHKHDETKKVRSLLCSRCNMVLGLISENEQTAINLANYIKNINK